MQDVADAFKLQDHTYIGVVQYRGESGGQVEGDQRRCWWSTVHARHERLLLIAACAVSSPLFGGGFFCGQFPGFAPTASIRPGPSFDLTP